MRHNHNTSRGGDGGRNRSSGPFLTDHLKDIDLELDLLKRKREMLEQQQQLMQPLMQQRSFNQQPFYQLEQKQGGSNRDFSHLYNDGSPQYRKPYGRKRQSDSDWQDNSYPKRSTGQGQRGSSFAGPSSARNQRSYSGQNQQTRSTPFKYEQGKQFVGQKINNQKQQRPSKNFVPNKVTKTTKAFVPPNKLASQPVADRNKLVAAAIMSVAEVETVSREALRLLPNEVPTKQMTGRLELALGAILRDVRDKYAESSHIEILRTPALQRVIKQAIRERVRSAMLGKIVGTTPEIVKHYRAMYPKDTDVEIVNIALEAAGISPEKVKPIVLERERPDEYFKSSMIQLIDSHLQEMFEKVEKIYKAENEDETSQREPAEGNNMEINSASVSEIAEKTIVAENEDNGAAVNNEADAPANGENIDAEKEDSVQAEKGDSVQAEKGDSVQAEESESIKKDVVEVTKAENTGIKNKNNGDSVNNENVATANAEKPTVEVAKDVNVTNAENSNTGPYNVEQLLSHANEYKRMLPRLLKRHIPTILKLLHLNKMYKRAVSDITATTRTKLVGKPEEAGSMETTEAPLAQAPKNLLSPYVVLPYYVKVMGKPQLPKKKIMNAFLEEFHPKSIKKHRSIHNLLFIGFVEKSDFDAIVQADGTAIGRSILSIRVCDKNAKSGENSQNNTSVSSTDQSVSIKNVKTEPATDGDGRGTELNGQLQVESKVDTIIKSVNQEDKIAIGTDDATVNDETIRENIDNIVQDIENIANAGDTENSGEVIKEFEKTENSVVTTSTDNLVEDTEKLNKIEEKLNQSDKEDIVKPDEQEKQVGDDEKNDQVAELKNTTGRATPTRASNRLANTPATPSSIRTRRASRQMQN